MKSQFAIVVAAGQGRRMGFKKQFVNLAERPMWLRSVDAMLYRDGIRVIVVAGNDDVPPIANAIAKEGLQSICTAVPGGATRHESVLMGVQRVVDTMVKENLRPADVLVLVHDAARPFVSKCDVEQVCQKASENGAAILGSYCRDTVKWVDSGAITKTLPRKNLFLAETPQVIRGDFLTTAYFDGHLSAPSDGFSPTELPPTDDSSLLESKGISVSCVESSSYNGKLTTPADLEYATWLAQKLWGTS